MAKQLRLSLGEAQGRVRELYKEKKSLRIELANERSQQAALCRVIPAPVWDNRFYNHNHPPLEYSNGEFGYNYSYSDPFPSC